MEPNPYLLRLVEMAEEELARVERDGGVVVFPMRIRDAARAGLAWDQANRAWEEKPPLGTIVCPECGGDGFVDDPDWQPPISQEFKWM